MLLRYLYQSKLVRFVSNLKREHLVTMPLIITGIKNKLTTEVQHKIYHSTRGMNDSRVLLEGVFEGSISSIRATSCSVDTVCLQLDVRQSMGPSERVPYQSGTEQKSSELRP